MNGWIAYLEMIQKPEKFPAKRVGFRVTLAERDWQINRDWYRLVGQDW